MTVFIFEGPDGAGKSFTALEFSKAVNLPIHHFGGPPESDEEIIERTKFLTSKDNIIFDRIPPISDQIYGKIVRGKLSILTMDDLEFLTNPGEDEEDNKDYKLIYCRPSIQTITSVSLEAKPHKSQKHTDSCKDNIERIISEYDQIMSQIPHILFNRDYQTTEELCRSLKRML